MAAPEIYVCVPGCSLYDRDTPVSTNTGPAGGSCGQPSSLPSRRDNPRAKASFGNWVVMRQECRDRPAAIASHHPLRSITHRPRRKAYLRKVRGLGD